MYQSTVLAPKAANVVRFHHLFKQEWAKPILQVGVKQFGGKEKLEVKAGSKKSEVRRNRSIVAAHKATFCPNQRMLGNGNFLARYAQPQPRSHTFSSHRF
jgi:hypothetical protein